MSYRTLKRALGETSLERKCRYLFSCCLLVLIATSFWWYGSRTEQLVYENTRSNCRHLVDAVLLHLHWTKVDTLKSNQAFVNQAATAMQTAQQYTARVLKPGGGDSDDDKAYQPETTFEKQALDYFTRKTPPDTTLADSEIEYQEQHVADKQEYRYFQPVRLKKECMICHGDLSKHQVLGSIGLPSPVFPHVGDMEGVVEIILPDERTQRALDGNRAILITTAIVTVVLAMFASYVIVRYIIVKPLKHLRDISDEVSRGNTDARVEINTADEFEDLGKAFNKMVRGLVSAQEELRTVNSSLDGKVDELAQANMRLYELNRLKSDFLATMSHELRTPLNSIIGFSDVLSSISALDDKQKRYVQNIQKSGRVLLDMINDILDLAKIESGKMELRLTDFHIAAAVSAQCDMARPLTEKKNIDLEIEIEPNLPELFQDQGKVQQILNNLLSNAIKFTPEGGRIVVSAKRDTAVNHDTHVERDELVLSIADTGVGIAEEDKVAIFEKFRQGKTALAGGDAMTREYSGTGLGLSIVKELCKLLGGEVSLISELGQGSTFNVRIPWVRSEKPRMDSPMAENIDELIRPRRAELQRTLDRQVSASPVAE